MPSRPIRLVMRRSLTASVLMAFPVATRSGVDPLAYKVVDGKLYVNYSKSVQRTWSRDIPGYISKANKNWQGLK